VSRRQDLLAALVNAQVGGSLPEPPGLDGEQRLGIAGISGAARARTWDTVASAHAPELTGETVTFVALEDGTLITDSDVPDGSLGPLADAVEKTLAPPYRAAGVREEGEVWSVAAEEVTVAELPGVEGDVVDLSVVGGVRELTIDGESTTGRLDALDALIEADSDVAVIAERIDGDLFTVDVFPL
jgi:hypothetical protein